MPHGIRKKSIRDPKSDVERQSSRIPELEQLMVELTEEAISVKMDYEQSGSNLDSGSLIAIHHNSTLLQDETEKLSDIAYEVKRKENE
jgi:hypothetical protein